MLKEGIHTKAYAEKRLFTDFCGIDILSDWRGTCLAQGKVKMVSKPA